MKNITNYRAVKYVPPLYTEVAPDVYKCEYGYVTSLCFEQEQEFDEGTHAADISQFPLEDVLDHFRVYVSDFYRDLNVEGSTTCYLEFCSSSVEQCQQLRDIIGKHVYNKESGGVIVLVIE